MTILIERDSGKTFSDVDNKIIEVEDVFVSIRDEVCNRVNGSDMSVIALGNRISVNVSGENTTLLAIVEGNVVRVAGCGDLCSVDWSGAGELRSIETVVTVRGMVTLSVAMRNGFSVSNGVDVGEGD